MSDLTRWASTLPEFRGPQRRQPTARWTRYREVIELLLSKGYPVARAVEAVAERENLSEKDTLRFQTAVRGWKHRKTLQLQD